MQHSELTSRLLSLSIEQTKSQTVLITELIRDTAAGVLPEGGWMAQIEAAAAKQASAQASDGQARIAKYPDKFKYGTKSRRELAGVHHILVDVCTLALRMSESLDWIVYDGLRTKEEQLLHIKNGTSSTLNSKHLPQADGLSHAIDLVPLIGGVPKWDWNGCYEIAMLMDRAATQLGHADKIVWGGNWYKTLAEYGGDKPKAYSDAVQAYRAQHPGNDFIDGPHFQLGK